jgi:factor associated with neutral sphingomyelinase activation
MELKINKKNVLNNHTSLKELIPEFYQLDDSFLLNKYNLNLGTR